MPTPMELSSKGSRGKSGYSDSMKEIWRMVSARPLKVKGVEKSLNRVATVQDAATPRDGQRTMADKLAAQAGALVNIPQISASIEKGVNTFMETAPVLIKILDGVAKTHPFIGVAVLAFKAVYALEVNRRNNDKRVLALYAEMKDMMGILIQLDGMSDLKKVAPDGQTIEGRIEKICNDVADDIEECARACDTYLKKKLLVKVFAAPLWEDRLSKFVRVFANRKKEFATALRIHTAVGVDEINNKLDNINQWMKAMTDAFQKFVPPEERQLASLINEKGREAIINNEQAMKQLFEKENSISTPAGKEKDKPPKFELAEIQRDIREEPTAAIKHNAESFRRKFEIQRRQIKEDIERAVEREGDRIISEVTAGPHERILDQDLYKIWKEMGWRGNVKAKYFVLALKDYYSEMVVGDGKGVAGSDRWALDYIGINHVRSILEAFDNDASGFITVKEANDFTLSRPLDWSLPHWLAYWAIGWQMTSTSYCRKIEEIFDAMITLSDKVLPENRNAVNEYINDVWEEVIIFVRSFRWEDGSEDLREKFQSYTATEEGKLRKNLEDIKYNIDSYDVVRLIAGHGRTETTLFPILYLVLERDLQKISLACKHVLADLELHNAVGTIECVTGAAMYRVFDLWATFEQQKSSPEEQFAIYAKGLFKIASEGNGFDGDRLRKLPDPIPARGEIYPNTDSIDPLDVLAHLTGRRYEIDFAAYDDPIPAILPPASGPDAILGTYYGFVYEGGSSLPSEPMKKWEFSRRDEPDSIWASGVDYIFGYSKAYTIKGTTGPTEDGKTPVELEVDYSSTWYGMSMTGYFDIKEGSLRGSVTIAGGIPGQFVFKRDQDLVRFRPAPSSMNAAARWKLVREVYCDRTRTRRSSWRDRIRKVQAGKRYMELSIRNEHYGRDLNDEESEELGELLCSLYESDARFYASIINIKLSQVPIHPMECDSCDATIGGARILCMDCHNDTTTINLCSEPECLNSVITPEYQPDLKTPHTPNHSMLKVHRLLFSRDTARTERNAKDALDAARETISDLKARKKLTPSCVRCRCAVSLPCWYCVDCSGGKFICNICEYKCLAFNETHTRKHTLVRVTQKVEKSVVAAEERLKAVEGQLGSMQNELSRMRLLLSELFGKGTGGSPGDPLTKGDILDVATVEPPPKGEGDRNNIRQAGATQDGGDRGGEANEGSSEDEGEWRGEDEGKEG